MKNSSFASYLTPPYWVALALGSISLLSFSIEALFALLVCFGGFNWVRQRHFEFDSSMKTVLLGLAALVLLRLPSTFMTDSVSLELLRMATLGHFLLAGLVLLGLQGSTLAGWRVVFWILLSSFLMWALVILPKVIVFDANLGHLIFSNSQIDTYGKVGQNRLVASTILGSLTLTGLVFLIRYFGDLKPLQKALLSTCWLVGVTTLAGSQARGPIVATLLVGAFIVFVMLLKKRVSTWVFAAVLAISAALFFILVSAAFERIHLTLNDLSRYLNGSTSTETAISIRLEMWRAALNAFWAKPFFGYGITGAVKAVDALTPYDIATYKHLHNEFLDTLISHGLVGLLGIFTLLFCLLKVALQWWRSEQWHLGLLMGCFVSYWLFCGFSNIAFRQGLLNSFFVIYLCALLSFHAASTATIKK
jgi:O-antigen ligase